MKRFVFVFAVLLLVGCTRTVFVPAESEHDALRSRHESQGVIDSVVHVERCSVIMMPHGVNSVTHRELHHYHTEHDTLIVVHTDTLRIVAPLPADGDSPKKIKWWWMIVGAALAVGVIGVLRKIFLLFR